MTKLRIGAFADTHCGYNGNASRYNSFGELRTEATLPNGMNIRTDDVNKAFSESIDIFNNEGVDIVLHGGDGMNDWGYKHPSYFNFYMGEVAKLNEAKYIEVAGNHNFAKKDGVGCELEKLNFLENAKAVYKGIYEQIFYDDLNIVVHALPSTIDNDKFNEELKKVVKVKDYFNILLTHCGVTSIDYYAKSESSIVASVKDLKEMDMDLVILGDYHSFTDFGDNIYYPGATERFSFSESNEKPRVLIFDIDTETKEVEVEHHFLNVRPMKDLSTIDATNKKIEEVQNELIKTLKDNEIDDSIVRIKISNLSKEMRHKHLFLNDEIIELQNKALIFRLVFETNAEDPGSIIGNTEVETIDIFEGFEDFIQTFDEDPNINKEEVIKLGNKYLREAYQNETD